MNSIASLGVRERWAGTLVGSLSFVFSSLILTPVHAAPLSDLAFSAPGGQGEAQLMQRNTTGTRRWRSHSSPQNSRSQLPGSLTRWLTTNQANDRTAVSPATATAAAPAPTSAPAAAPSAGAPPVAPATVPTSPAPSNPAAPNAGAVGVYVNFATGPDHASSNLGVVASDPSQPLGVPWYTSPAVTRVFGGVPSAVQQQELEQMVLDGMNQDYAAAGLPVHFSTNPSGASRLFSIMANASAAENPAWIGIGNENGPDAISFLDHFSFAPDERSLANALRHNGDHEIGHTLGMEHTQTTGFLDSAMDMTDAMMSDNLAFTPTAVQAIRATVAGMQSAAGGVNGQSVSTPEPASWMVLATVFALGLGRRHRSGCEPLPG